MVATIAERLAPLWVPFHEYAWFYSKTPTTEEKERAQVIYEKLFPDLIFCQACRDHYLQMIVRTPPDLSSRDALFRWSVDRHNEVNLRLNKPVIPYDVVYKAYETGQLPLRTESSLWQDLKDSLTFKERVMLVVVVLTLAILIVRKILGRLATMLFC